MKYTPRGRKEQESPEKRILKHPEQVLRALRKQLVYEWTTIPKAKLLLVVLLNFTIFYTIAHAVLILNYDIQKCTITNNGQTTYTGDYYNTVQTWNKEVLRTNEKMNIIGINYDPQAATSQKRKLQCKYNITYWAQKENKQITNITKILFTIGQ